MLTALALVVAMVWPAPVARAANQYWDTSSSSGLQAGDGPWSTNNGSANRQWKPNSDGSGTAASWTNGNDAFFQTSGSSLVTIDTTNQPTANSLTFNGTGYTIQAGTLTLSGTHTITTNAAATINSAIDGTAGLIKAGTANLTLGGTNTVTGTTSINAGTLTLNGSYSSSSGAANSVDINSTGKLAGTGTVSRIVNLNPGGTISPAGDGSNSTIGTLSTGAQNWAGGSTYVWEIKDAAGAAGTGYDTLNSSGALTVNATSSNKMTIKIASHAAVSNFNGVNAWTWTIATGASVSNFSGNAFLLDLSDFVDDNPAADPSAFSVSSSGGSIRISYVPEPASAIGIGFAGFAALLRRRRPKTIAGGCFQ